MEENNKNLLKTALIIIAIVSIITIIIVGLMIRSAANKSGIEEETINLLDYLNTKYKSDNNYKSPIYSLLSYNFDKINDKTSTKVLEKTNMLYNSEADQNKINQIYQDKFGKSKQEYESSTNYVAFPETNCYYHQNVLKENNYNCDNECSKSREELISILYNKYNLTNATDEQINTYCLKNALFALDNEITYVDLEKVKNLFLSITGKTLEYDDEILNNDYYKYGVYAYYINDENNDMINNITSLTIEKISGKKIIANYVALTIDDKELSGTLTVKKDNEEYIILSNEINTNRKLYE